MLRSLRGTFRVLGALMFGTRIALCLVVLAAGGMRQANATPLDDAAERYRPYMIEGIGSALAGPRGLGEGGGPRGLSGGEEARLPGPAGGGALEGFTPRLVSGPRAPD